MFVRNTHSPYILSPVTSQIMRGVLIKSSIVMPRASHIDIARQALHIEHAVTGTCQRHWWLGDIGCEGSGVRGTGLGMLLDVRDQASEALARA